ncbi:hypothetical protein C5F59_038335 [Streptomyces sp. QL37]|uniref:hypothetical protein n=1 Tax=Streptomyces sp. QL37 TaxID=2093747 RepID=UPI0021CB45A3|nr:hypothetical protein [Streptomyces sp. QL37]
MYDCFPQDLREAQLALHRTRSAYEEYARTLPRPAEPMPGKAARLRAEFLELSTAVSTHPFWAALTAGEAPQGRMSPEHTHGNEIAAVDEAA